MVRIHAPPQMKNIWRLFELVPGYKGRLLKVVLVNSVLGLVGLATPYLLKVTLDRVVAAAGGTAVNTSEITAALSILIAVSLVGVLFDYIGERLGDLLFIDIMWEVRKRVFNHLASLSVHYYEKNRSGEIMERISSGTMAFARWAFAIADGFLGVSITIILAIIFLWTQVPLVGLLVSISVPVNFLLVINRIIKTKPIREEWSKHAEQGMGEMGETLSQISTVRSFGQEKQRLVRYTKQVDEYRNLRIEQSKIEWQTNAARGVLNAATFIGAIAIVAWGIVNGHNSVGDIVMISLYIQQIRGNIAPLSRILTDTGDVETSAGRMATILDAEPAIADRPDAIPIETLESIEFQNVSFQYPGKTKKVLRNVSFTIKRGEIAALVGPSGVGKSTITKLLLRFYEPSSGIILINGQPIETFTQESLRQLIGMVMQDVALFNDTIKENLRFANPTATDQDISKASKIAHADTFIAKLPEKYETLVGERGVRLSGGEKQRVAIARAILRNPQLVILDEATSALDSQSEQYVQDGLQKLLENKTAIVIAHRLSTVMRADKIIVLENGAVLEQGSHDELMKKKGLYAKLFSMQAEGLRAFDLKKDYAT